MRKERILSDDRKRETGATDHFFFFPPFFLGLVLPCDLRKVLPFLVFLSPLPMIRHPLSHFFMEYLLE